MLDMQFEVQVMRDEMASLAKVAEMASEEAQRTTLRMDALEYEWLLWNEVRPQDAPGPQQPEPEGGHHPSSTPVQPPFWAPLTPTALTPTAATPRNSEVIQQPDLLQLEDDPLSAWHASPGTPGVSTQLPPHALEPPQGPDTRWRRPAHRCGGCACRRAPRH